MTRYENARKEWDSRIGSARVQAYHWRLVALIEAVALAAAIIGMVAIAMKAEVRPYVVEVRETGQIRLVGEPNTQQFVPSDAMVAYALERFVAASRQTTDDAAVARTWWRKASSVLGGEAHTHLKDWMREYRGEHAPKGCRVQPIASHRLSAVSWRLEWLEVCEMQAPQRWVGLFTIELAPATDLVTLKRNPLGVWITQFTWSASTMTTHGGAR